MADLAQIAQSGVDPASGSYLSAERRKAIFAKSRNISSNIFRRGGSLVAINRQPDEGALALVQTQSQTITSLREEVNTLRTRVNGFDEVIRIQTQTIGGVQQQIGGLSTEVTDFSGALNRITDVIAYDSVLEQNRTKQEQEEQRRATEQGLRVGRESLLEKAIQGALIAPVQKIAQKAQSILDKVKQFFTTLFIGWFTNQGIEVLKALSENNGKKLEEIRDNVLKGLGIAAGTLFLLNGGFFAIAATITRLSLKIGGWLLKNTVGRFFGALGSLLKSAGNAIVSTAKVGIAALTGSGAKAATASAAGSADDVARAAAGAGANVTDDAAKAAAKTSAKTAGRFIPGLGTVISGTAALYDFSKGDILGGALNTIGMAPGPFGWAGTFGRLALEGTRIAGAINNKPKTPSATSPSATKVSTPQTKAIPPKSTTTTSTAAPASTPALSDKPFEQQMSDLKTQADTIDFTKPAVSGEINITPGKEGEDSKKPGQVNIKPIQAQTKGVPTTVSVGPAPDPTPNIIYKRVGSSAKQQSGAAPTGGSVNEVPAISASNPDNFYVLYSQVNYNVVT